MRCILVAMSTAPASTAAAPGGAAVEADTGLNLVHTGARPEQIRRRELAAFLRSRRERISPEQVGLPSGGRRRTPGLRREEVAQLAAVGVTWYTWLEQARDIQCSPQVLDAVSRALLLDSGERAHLFALAGSADPSAPEVCPTVTPTVQALLTQVSPMPAVVLNSRYDMLAYNPVYSRLIGDLDALEPADRNIMWLAFTDPAWRDGLPDREAALGSMVAKFRAAMADHVAEPVWKTMVKRLQLASPEFAELWRRHDVAATADGTKRFRNAQVGLLHFDFTNLWLGPRPGPRLVVYNPADEETRARVARLHELVTTPQP